MDILDEQNASSSGNLNAKAIQNLSKVGDWTILLGIVCLIISGLALLVILTLYKDYTRTYSYVLENNGNYGLDIDFWENMARRRFRVLLIMGSFLTAGASLLTMTAVEGFRYYTRSKQFSVSKSVADAERCTQSIFKAVRYLGFTAIVGIVGVFFFIAMAANNYF